MSNKYSTENAVTEYKNSKNTNNNNTQTSTSNTSSTYNKYSKENAVTEYKKTTKEPEKPKTTTKTNSIFDAYNKKNQRTSPRTGNVLSDERVIAKNPNKTVAETKAEKTTTEKTSLVDKWKSRIAEESKKEKELESKAKEYTPFEKKEKKAKLTNDEYLKYNNRANEIMNELVSSNYSDVISKRNDLSSRIDFADKYIDEKYGDIISYLEDVKARVENGETFTEEEALVYENKWKIYEEEVLPALNEFYKVYKEYESLDEQSQLIADRLTELDEIDSILESDKELSASLGEKLGITGKGGMFGVASVGSSATRIGGIFEDVFNKIENFTGGGFFTEGKALLSATFDSLFPDDISIYDNGILNSFADAVDKEIEAFNEERSITLRDNPNWNKAVDISQIIGAMIPMMVITAATAGGFTAVGETLATNGVYASASSSALSGVQGAINTVGRTVRTMTNNPSWQASFAQTLGSSYNEAKKDGATTSQAILYSLLNSFIGASIEVGGIEGDESLKLIKQFINIKETRGIKYALDFVKSIAEEIGEEELQGIFENGLKSIYGKDVKAFSSETRNELINYLGEDKVNEYFGNPNYYANENKNQVGLIDRPIQTAVDTAIATGITNAVTTGLNIRNDIKNRAIENNAEYQKIQAYLNSSKFASDLDKLLSKKKNQGLSYEEAKNILINKYLNKLNKKTSPKTEKAKETKSTEVKDDFDEPTIIDESKRKTKEEFLEEMKAMNEDDEEDIPFTFGETSQETIKSEIDDFDAPTDYSKTKENPVISAIENSTLKETETTSVENAKEIKAEEKVESEAKNVEEKTTSKEKEAVKNKTVFPDYFTEKDIDTYNNISSDIAVENVYNRITREYEKDKSEAGEEFIEPEFTPSDKTIFNKDNVIVGKDKIKDNKHIYYRLKQSLINMIEVTADKTYNPIKITDSNGKTILLFTTQSTEFNTKSKDVKQAFKEFVDNTNGTISLRFLRSRIFDSNLSAEDAADIIIDKLDSKIDEINSYEKIRNPKYDEFLAKYPNGKPTLEQIEGDIKNEVSESEIQVGRSVSSTSESEGTVDNRLDSVGENTQQERVLETHDGSDSTDATGETGKSEENVQYDREQQLEETKQAFESSEDKDFEEAKKEEIESFDADDKKISAAVELMFGLEEGEGSEILAETRLNDKVNKKETFTKETEEDKFQNFEPIEDTVERGIEKFVKQKNDKIVDWKLFTGRTIYQRGIGVDKKYIVVDKNGNIMGTDNDLYKAKQKANSKGDFFAISQAKADQDLVFDEKSGELRLKRDIFHDPATNLSILGKSIASEKLGIRTNKFGSAPITTNTFKLNIFESARDSDSEALNTKEYASYMTKRLDQIIKGNPEKGIKPGITIGNKHYVFAGVSANGIKKGDIYMMEENTYNKIRNHMHANLTEEQLGEIKAATEITSLGILFTPSNADTGLKLKQAIVMPDVFTTQHDVLRNVEHVSAEGEIDIEEAVKLYKQQHPDATKEQEESFRNELTSSNGVGVVTMMISDMINNITDGLGIHYHSKEKKHISFQMRATGHKGMLVSWENFPEMMNKIMKPGTKFMYTTDNGKVVGGFVKKDDGVYAIDKWNQERKLDDYNVILFESTSKFIDAKYFQGDKKGADHFYNKLGEEDIRSIPLENIFGDEEASSGMVENKKMLNLAQVFRNQPGLSKEDLDLSIKEHTDDVADEILEDPKKIAKLHGVDLDSKMLPLTSDTKGQLLYLFGEKALNTSQFARWTAEKLIDIYRKASVGSLFFDTKSTSRQYVAPDMIGLMNAMSAITYQYNEKTKRYNKDSKASPLFANKALGKDQIINNNLSSDNVAIYRSPAPALENLQFRKNVKNDPFYDVIFNKTGLDKNVTYLSTEGTIQKLLDNDYDGDTVTMLEGALMDRLCAMRESLHLNNDIFTDFPHEKVGKVLVVGDNGLQERINYLRNAVGAPNIGTYDKLIDKFAAFSDKEIEKALKNSEKYKYVTSVREFRNIVNAHLNAAYILAIDYAKTGVFPKSFKAVISELNDFMYDISKTNGYYFEYDAITKKKNSYKTTINLVPAWYEFASNPDKREEYQRALKKEKESKGRVKYIIRNGNDILSQLNSTINQYGLEKDVRKKVDSSIRKKESLDLSSLSPVIEEIYLNHTKVMKAFCNAWDTIMVSNALSSNNLTKEESIKAKHDAMIKLQNDMGLNNEQFTALALNSLSLNPDRENWSLLLSLHQDNGQKDTAEIISDNVKILSNQKNIKNAKELINKQIDIVKKSVSELKSEIKLIENEIYAKASTIDQIALSDAESIINKVSDYISNLLTTINDDEVLTPIAIKEQLKEAKADLKKNEVGLDAYNLERVHSVYSTLDAMIESLTTSIESLNNSREVLRLSMNMLDNESDLYDESKIYKSNKSGLNKTDEEYVSIIKKSVSSDLESENVDDFEENKSNETVNKFYRNYDVNAKAKTTTGDESSKKADFGEKGNNSVNKSRERVQKHEFKYFGTNTGRMLATSEKKFFTLTKSWNNFVKTITSGEIDAPLRARDMYSRFNDNKSGDWDTTRVLYDPNISRTLEAYCNYYERAIKNKTLDDERTKTNLAKLLTNINNAVENHQIALDEGISLTVEANRFAEKNLKGNKKDAHKSKVSIDLDLGDKSFVYILKKAAGFDKDSKLYKIADELNDTLIDKFRVVGEYFDRYIYSVGGKTGYKKYSKDYLEFRSGKKTIDVSGIIKGLDTIPENIAVDILLSYYELFKWNDNKELSKQKFVLNNDKSVVYEGDIAKLAVKIEKNLSETGKRFKEEALKMASELRHMKNKQYIDMYGNSLLFNEDEKSAWNIVRIPVDSDKHSQIKNDISLGYLPASYADTDTYLSFNNGEKKLFANIDSTANYALWKQMRTISYALDHNVFGKSLQEIYSDTYGKEAGEIVDYMGKVMMESVHNNTRASTFANNITGANIFLNPTVWFSQTASLPTGAAIVGKLSAIKGLISLSTWDLFTSKAEKEMRKHNPLLAYREMNSGFKFESNQRSFAEEKIYTGFLKKISGNMINNFDYFTQYRGAYHQAYDYELSKIKNKEGLWDFKQNKPLDVEKFTKDVESTFSKLCYYCSPVYDAKVRPYIQNTDRVGLRLVAGTFQTIQSKLRENLNVSKNDVKFAEKKYGKKSNEAKEARRLFSNNLSGIVASSLMQGFIKTSFSILANLSSYYGDDDDDGEDEFNLTKAITVFGKNIAISLLGSTVPVFGIFSSPIVSTASVIGGAASNRLLGTNLDDYVYEHLFNSEFDDLNTGLTGAVGIVVSLLQGKKVTVRTINNTFNSLQKVGLGLNNKGFIDTFNMLANTVNSIRSEFGDEPLKTVNLINDIQDCIDWYNEPMNHMFDSRTSDDDFKKYKDKITSKYNKDSNKNSFEIERNFKTQITNEFNRRVFIDGEDPEELRKVLVRCGLNNTELAKIDDSIKYYNQDIESKDGEILTLGNLKEKYISGLTAYDKTDIYDILRNYNGFTPEEAWSESNSYEFLRIMNNKGIDWNDADDSEEWMYNLSKGTITPNEAIELRKEFFTEFHKETSSYDNEAENELAKTEEASEYVASLLFNENIGKDKNLKWDKLMSDYSTQDKKISRDELEDYLYRFKFQYLSDKEYKDMSDEEVEEAKKLKASNRADVFDFNKELYSMGNDEYSAYKLDSDEDAFVNKYHAINNAIANDNVKLNALQMSQFREINSNAAKQDEEKSTEYKINKIIDKCIEYGGNYDNINVAKEILFTLNPTFTRNPKNRKNSVIEKFENAWSSKH